MLYIFCSVLGMCILEKYREFIYSPVVYRYLSLTNRSGLDSDK